ncbi:MAG: prepilin-type N-terminal cleavage/methylation domain-containing protein [Bdellovibrio sp.]|nr:prepilin-type N-terminal cleavage/methylation domain-containing protein [Bdellovibrio sp.]
MQNRKGFTLVETLIGAALLGVVATGSMSMLNSSEQAKQKNQIITTIIKFRYNLISNLRSPEGVNKTGVFNGIPCLTNPLACGSVATAYAGISVQDAIGQVLTNRDTASHGFGLDLVSCTTFPSKLCPFRYETQWRSVCNSANNAFCSSPQLKVKGILKIDESIKPINFNLYSFEVTLGQVLGTYEQSCASLGGTYYPGNPPRCESPMAGDCATGSIVVGYNKAAKTLICRPYFKDYFNGVVIPPDNVIIGVDGAGSPIVRAIIPQTAPFPSQLIPSDPSPPAMGDGGFGGGVFNGGGGGGDGGCGGGDGAC